MGKCEQERDGIHYLFTQNPHLPLFYSSERDKKKNQKTQNLLTTKIDHLRHFHASISRICMCNILCFADFK